MMNSGDEPDRDDARPPDAAEPRSSRKKHRRQSSKVRRVLGDFFEQSRDNLRDVAAVLRGFVERVQNDLYRRGMPRKWIPFFSWNSRGKRRHHGRAFTGVSGSFVEDELGQRSPAFDLAKSVEIRPIQGRELNPRFRNVLVVGALDSLGAGIVRQLNAADFREITIAGALGEAACAGLPALGFREFLSAEEFRDMASSKFRAISDYSHVFYLDSWRSGDVALTKALLAAALRANARFIAFAPASSIGHRAEGAEGIAHEPEQFRPSTEPGLLSCFFDRYALSKAPHRNYLSLKFHQIVGEGAPASGEPSALIGSVCAQIHSSRAVRLPSALRPDTPEGARRYDFLSAHEAVRMALHLAQSHVSEGVYELGSGISATPFEVVQAVIRATGADVPITWDDGLAYSAPPAQPPQALLGRLAEAGWTSSGTDPMGDLARGLAGGSGGRVGEPAAPPKPHRVHTAVPQKKKPAADGP
jgi:nucleoside-diphosphate-sugar epimerase